MLDLADPLLRSFVRATEEAPADVASAMALADWLSERDATAGEVALLYAGTPPEHKDGIGLRCLALWLYDCQHRHEEGRAIGDWMVVPVAASGHCCVWQDGWSKWFDAPTGARTTRVAAERDLKRRVLSLPWAKDVQVIRQASISRRLWQDARLTAELLSSPYILSPVSQVSGLQRKRQMIADELLRAHILTGAGVPVHVREDRWYNVVHVSQRLTAPQLIWPEPREDEP